MMYDTSLAEYVRKGFDGILVFGDVHGDFEAINRAYDYSVKENFFFVSLGDLVDRSRQPYETIELMHKVIQDGRGAFTMGNHDDKFHRHISGSTVQFSRDANQTLEDVGDSRKDKFFKMYMEVMNDRFFSNVFHTFDDFVFVHAAAHKSMFTGFPNVTKTERARYLVGETNGERHEDGYPVRLYNWVNDIPSGKTVIVGHDRTPVNPSSVITEPHVKTNNNGGKAVFIDTGGGKGGHVTGVVIMPDKKGIFRFIRYTDFK
jgi:Calcineurin-like phosphoesterase